MTLHADAVAALTRWVPPDAEQAGLREEYLTYLRTHGDALSRHCAPDHLTASAVIADSDARRVLLTLHPVVGRWLQTGGHCEPGDASLAAAAAREAAEESGIPCLRIDPSPVRLSRHPAPCSTGRGQHLDVQFLAVSPAAAVERCSAESVALGWFAATALPPDTDDSVRALVDAALVRLRG